MASKLCVHPQKLTLAFDVKKVIRDRYRLKSVVKDLRMSKDQCVACRDVLVDLDSVDSSRCCRSHMHVMCIRRITVCPGCGEGWTPLPCCQCSKRMFYSKDLVERTACCDADIHEHCLHRLKSKPCPSCGFPLDSSGYPYPPRSVSEYVILRRRIQRLRNGVNT